MKNIKTLVSTFGLLVLIGCSGQSGKNNYSALTGNYLTPIAVGDSTIVFTQNDRWTTGEITGAVTYPTSAVKTGTAGEIISLSAGRGRELTRLEAQEKWYESQN